MAFGRTLSKVLCENPPGSVEPEKAKEQHEKGLSPNPGCLGGVVMSLQAKTLKGRVPGVTGTRALGWREAAGLRGKGHWAVVRHRRLKRPFPWLVQSPVVLGPCPVPLHGHPCNHPFTGPVSQAGGPWGPGTVSGFLWAGAP